MSNGPTPYQKKDLGRHAFEERMPKRVACILHCEDSTNSRSRVVLRLSELLQSERNVQMAYLCHEATVQVYKISNEGNHFCGYRNIQMLCLALGLSTGYPGLGEKLSIPELQVMIEQAWDRGFNRHDRVQTGGIVATRKHIGTPEAEALFLNLGVCCKAHAFSGPNACRQLFDTIEQYFASQCHEDEKLGIHVTSRMPIFLQRPGHSLTVVGIERVRSGKRNLLVFDPAYRPPRSISWSEPRSKFVGKWTQHRLLGIYCRSENHLKRYVAFETLTIDQELPAKLDDL